MPELGTSGSVRGRDGQPPGLLDLQSYRETYANRDQPPLQAITRERGRQYEGCAWRL
jgi:hypothetical protein